MYLVRTEMMVGAGQAADFEERQVRMTGEAVGTVGCIGGSLLHSYSHPRKYAVTRTFDSVGTAWDYGKSDVFTTAMKSQPAGAVTVAQEEGDDLAHEVIAEPLPGVGCEILIDEVLKGPEVILAFEATLGELFEVRKTYSQGYGYSRLLRSGGRLGRYLVIQGYAGLAAAGTANTPADVQEFIRTNPADLYTDKEVFPEAYDVLFRA